MPINRLAKKLIALTLGGVAVAVAAHTSAQALAAQPVAQSVIAAADRGNPNAVPPLLPPLRPSELAELRRAEAQKQPALSYRLPSSASYSSAEMEVFAPEGYA